MIYQYKVPKKDINKILFEILNVKKIALLALSFSFLAVALLWKKEMLSFLTIFISIVPCIFATVLFLLIPNVLKKNPEILEEQTATFEADQVYISNPKASQTIAFTEVKKIYKKFGYYFMRTGSMGKFAVFPMQGIPSEVEEILNNINK